jgi:hypothetical protein
MWSNIWQALYQCTGIPIRRPGPRIKALPNIHWSAKLGERADGFGYLLFNCRHACYQGRRYCAHARNQNAGLAVGWL